MRELLHDMSDVMSRTAALGRRLATTIRGPVLWLTLCGGVLVAAIFVGTIMMAGEFRERALTNSERELENTVLLLSRHFDQQFDDSNTIAADVISRLEISGIASGRAVCRLKQNERFCRVGDGCQLRGNEAQNERQHDRS